jgi:hypothetical protein
MDIRRDSFAPISEGDRHQKLNPLKAAQSHMSCGARAIERFLEHIQNDNVGIPVSMKLGPELEIFTCIFLLIRMAFFSPGTYAIAYINNFVLIHRRNRSGIVHTITFVLILDEDFPPILGSALAPVAPMTAISRPERPAIPSCMRGLAQVSR